MAITTSLNSSTNNESMVFVVMACFCLRQLVIWFVEICLYILQRIMFVPETINVEMTFVFLCSKNYA